jgi:hypothetical protein
MYAGPFEHSPIARNRSLFVIHVLRETLARHTFPVHIKRKIAGIVVPKFVWVGVQ